MKKLVIEGNLVYLAMGAFGIFAIGAIMTTAVPPLFDATLYAAPAGQVVHEYTEAEERGIKIYMREGCVYCHTQQIRDEVTGDGKRYGWRTLDAPPSESWEYINDKNHFLGTKRTGPDLGRVGGKYASEWHWAHFENPRDMGEKFYTSGLNPRTASVMPSFRYLTNEEVKDLTAYLQTLGRNLDWRASLNDYEE